MVYNKTTLPNGLRIITIPMSGTNTATVLVMVGTGSHYEEKSENGISHFLEHMAFKGTKKRPTAMQIATELDSVGGEHNAFTGYEYTGYWAKVDFLHADLALDIISDISQNSLLQEEEINKERGVIIAEMNMYEDLPNRRVVEDFLNLVYGNQPAGWDIVGTKENIDRFNRSDFAKYREEHYKAENTIVAITGNIESKKVEKSISDLFGVLPKAEPKNKTTVKEDKNLSKTLIKFKETNQSHFCLGGFSYKLSDERKIAAEILFSILGRGMSSRLFTSIREKNGLAYYVKADNDSMVDTGVFMIRAGVDSSQIEKAIDLAINELREIKNNKVDSGELKKVKNMIRGGILIDLESSDDVATWFASQEILENKIETPEEYFAKIDAVTAEQVQETANDLFTDDNLRLAMIGPHKDGNRFEKLLKV